MKCAPLLAWSLCVATACADWRDDLTSPTPGKFPPPAPMKTTYKFGWSGISAATADFDFSKTKRGDLRLTVNARTVGPVRALWRMDAQHDATCRAGSLQPVSLVQSENYKSKSSVIRANFDAAGVSSIREMTPPDKTPAKARRFDCPHVFDLQSALLFIRSQRLQPGDRYCVVVFPANSAYLAQATVAGRDKVKVAGREYDATRLDIALQQIRKDFTLAPHRKFKRATAWVSDDRDRLLLKAQADISVGSVWAEMQKVEFAAK